MSAEITQNQPHDAIVQIEARIEELAEQIERCRKLSLAAKIAIGAGSAWILFTLLGLIVFYPSAMLAALAAVIGGIVLLGSNSTTWAQAETALRQSEATRAVLIGQLQMRVVDPGVRTLH